MICVSIGQETHEAMIREYRQAAANGAALVELRLDWLTERPDLGRLLADRSAAVVVTCRRQIDQGHWRFSEQERLDVLNEAIQAGAEYVDLEDDIAGSISRSGTGKRIVSHHNFEKTPNDLAAIHQRMCVADPDIVKLVTMATTPADGVRMLRLVDEARVPTIGFCMGEFGTPSRVLCGRFGAPFTYAPPTQAGETAPGQVSFDQMRDLYRFDSITRKTRIFGVLGDPIAHSLSPLLHNLAFQHVGIDAVYLPFRVSAETLQETLQEFDWLGLEGYSVTIPHKQGVLHKVDSPDRTVQTIGAANTLFRNTDGSWQAANTDYEAALASLRVGLELDPPEDITSPALAGRNVLMLGAGGVARAIGLGVVQTGGNLTITNRSPERAQALADEIGCQTVEWQARGDVAVDVIINCTSLGMHPRVDETPFPADRLKSGTLVFDTVYNPETTQLLADARRHGCRTVNGLEMFVRQAARQFEIFTGQSAPLEFMRQTLRDHLPS